MQKIKYDVKDKKIYFRLAIIVLILFIADIVVLNVADLGRMSTELEVFLVILSMVLGPLDFALWVRYAEVVGYLHRLSKYGYELPYNKKDYGDNQEQLIHSVDNMKQLSDKNIGSIILTICSGGTLIGLIIYYYSKTWQYSSVVFGGVLPIIIIMWLILAIYYARQISNREYKDDVQIDALRKDRTPIINGIVTIMLLLFITWMGIEILNDILSSCC